jgi:hypothetical protein
MRHSDSIVNIVKALAEASAKIVAPTKDTTGQVGNKPYKYADLAAVRASYQKPLAEQGILVIHALTPVDGHVVLATTLQHTSGEWIASEVPMSTGLKPQDFGSALTYYRRYNITALLDLAAEDDDGKAAQDASSKPAAAPQATIPPAPAQPQATAPKPVLSNDEIVSVQAAAKRAGIPTPAALAPVLSNIVPGVTKASELSKKDLPVVLEALKGMAQKVPA